MKLLGLDIGSNAVKFVEIAPGRQGPAVLKSGASATPPGAVVDGEVVKPDEVARVIRDALRRAGCRARRVACAVNGSGLLLRVVELPPLPPDQLKKSLRWELERFVPYSAGTVEYDVQPLDMLPDKVVGLLVTAPRATITSLLATLEQACLIPEILEPGPLALLRFIRSYYPSVIDADPVLVLDLGAFSVKLLIQNKGRLEFARTILLKEFGTEKEAWERLVGEIRRSADYFFLQHRLTPHFSTCLCTGGLAKENAFLRMLEVALGVPVLVVELSDQSQNQDAGHLLATAAGLALGEV